MTRLSFGLLPGQSASLFCLEQAILENKTNASANTISTATKSFYIDVGLFSFTSEKELIAFFIGIVPLLASRSYPLCGGACGGFLTIVKLLRIFFLHLWLEG